MKIIKVNLIFFCRNLNIYEACVPDRMHHINLGLFKYQLKFTQEILKQVEGTGLQKIFDKCIRQVLRFPGFKLLSKLGQLKVMTGGLSSYNENCDICLRWNF